MRQKVLEILNWYSQSIETSEGNTTMVIHHEDFETIVDEIAGKCSRLKYALASIFNTTVEEIDSPSRKKEPRQARQVGMWYLMEYEKATQKSAGAEFNKDHSTARYSKLVVENDRDSDPTLKKRIVYLIERMS